VAVERNPHHRVTHCFKDCGCNNECESFHGRGMLS
jgi:hypothetical protein